MWRRGANRNGDVANFVETEQILEVNGHLASYVQVGLCFVFSLLRLTNSAGFLRIIFSQVRGSIPVLWQQIVDLTYKPKIEISDLEESVSLSVFLLMQKMVVLAILIYSNKL